MPVQPNPPAAGPAVTITSFGYLHGAPPPGAHLTIDVRQHVPAPDDADPALRPLDATGWLVYSAVMATPGARGLVLAIASLAAALLGEDFGAARAAGPVSVAIGSAAGRHRAPALALAAASLLHDWGVPASAGHRDIGSPAAGGASGSAG